MSEGESRMMQVGVPQISTGFRGTDLQALPPTAGLRVEAPWLMAPCFETKEERKSKLESLNGV